MTDQRAERDTAIARVDNAASETFRWASRLALRIIACQRQTFTADAVWPILREHGIEPREPRAMGPTMLHGVHAGWIVGTKTMQKSQHPSRPNHLRPQELFRSLIYGQTSPEWPTETPTPQGPRCFCGLEFIEILPSLVPSYAIGRCREHGKQMVRL